jgi:hypothetical protein
MDHRDAAWNPVALKIQRIQTLSPTLLTSQD